MEVLGALTLHDGLLPGNCSCRLCARSCYFMELRIHSMQASAASGGCRHPPSPWHLMHSVSLERPCRLCLCDNRAWPVPLQTSHLSSYTYVCVCQQQVAASKEAGGVKADC